MMFVGLSDAQKNQVWKDYVKTGDLGGIRTSIFAARTGRYRLSEEQALTNLPRD